MQLPSSLQSGESFENSDLWYEAYAQAVLEKLGLADTVSRDEYLNDHHRLLLSDLTAPNDRKYSIGQDTEGKFHAENAAFENRKCSINNRRVSFQDKCCLDTANLKSDRIQSDASPNWLSCEGEIVANKRLKVESTHIAVVQGHASASVSEETEKDYDSIARGEGNVQRESQDSTAFQRFQELDEEELDSALLGSWMEPKNYDV